jgi:hypothetical protein
MALVLVQTEAVSRERGPAPFSEGDEPRLTIKLNMNEMKTLAQML